jgi:hypothetical protein
MGQPSHRVPTDDRLKGDNDEIQQVVAAIVAGCAAVLMSAMPSVAGQMPQGPPKAATAKAKPEAGMATDMAAKCQAMMADHEKMMTDMKAADQRPTTSSPR